MSEERTILSKSGSRRTLLSLTLAALMLVVLFQTLSASQDDEEALPPDLSLSSKSVDLAEAGLQDTLRYSILLRNDGGQAATEVVMTDVLPAELKFEAGSLEALPDIGLYGESGGVITWTGALNVNQEIALAFSAVVTGEVAAETTITNTAVISAGDLAYDRSAYTVVVSDTWSLTYFPFIAKTPPNMSIAVLARPDSNNRWTIGFTAEDTTLVTGYQIQEAHDPSFVGAVLIKVDDPGLNSVTRTHAPSNSNVYYYRARSIAGAVPGLWSDVIMVVGHYYDDFSDSKSGWRTVRQDTDDSENGSYYSGGKFVHRQHGRWDYLVSSPVMPAPDGSYRIETNARFVGQDNLHTLGIVFGGDSDGRNCPVSNYSSCMNHYYRLLAIWYSDDSGRLRIQLKRIDYHDKDNVGRGASLVAYKDVRVKSPPSGWQRWTIDYYSSGRINIYVNGNLVASAKDSTYFNDRYFGGFSATNEYAGLEVQFDSFEAKLLP